MFTLSEIKYWLEKCLTYQREIICTQCMRFNFFKLLKDVISIYTWIKRLHFQPLTDNWRHVSTPWSWVLERQRELRHKKFSEIYGTQIFIILILSQMSPVHNFHSVSVLSLIYIYFSYGLFSSNFQVKSCTQSYSVPCLLHFLSILSS
jgi:hypothetical protein